MKENRKDTESSIKERAEEVSAMAFYHEDGLVPAWKFASQFAGEEGRIATLPDVINARLATESGSVAWERYLTTSTAEFVGRKRDGSMAIIVAHGIGPMSTLDGILKTYSYEYKNRSCDHRGGRISQEEFWKLEDGVYGRVDVIDLEKLLSSYEYPFLGVLSKFEAAVEPLLSARFGPNARKYINKHAEVAYKWHKEEGHDISDISHDLDVFDPYILEMGDASNCSYQHFSTEEDMAFAHLISIGGLVDCGHWRRERQIRSIVSDVSCHEWSNGVRFVGINTVEEITSIHSGIEDVSNLIFENWPSLMRLASQVLPIGLRALKQIDQNTWFTQYPKMGASMDTDEPEFQVLSMKLIGKPVDFVTEIGGHHMFFRYDIKEVETIMPVGANAYCFANEPEVIYSDDNPKYHKVKIQFYRIEANTAQRLVRDEELRNDYDTLIKLITKK